MSDPSEPLFVAPGRLFQLWGFTVSMGRLLFRSPKSAGFDSRVDLLFQNVVYLETPSLLRDLSLHNLPSLLSQPRFQNVVEDGIIAFSVHSGDVPVGTVLASRVTHIEDERDYYEPSTLWPGPERLDGWPHF